MSNGDTSIEQKLRTAWSKEQRFFHIRGLARLLIWAVVLVLVDLVIDWQILFRSRLTGYPQILLLLINVGVLGWVIWNEWLRHLKGFDAVRVSLEVEANHPKLRSILVSYMQFEDHDAESLKASQSLLDAMRNQAISLTSPLDFREVVDFRQLRNLFLFAAVCIGGFSLVSYSRSDHMRSLFLRLVGMDKDYPTKTKVEVVTKNTTIKQGESVEIVAIAKGKIPESGRLYSRSDSGSPQSKTLKKGDELAEFKTIVPEVFEAFTYYIRIGDARTEEFTVSVSPPPEIVSTQISFTYPEYLDRDGSLEPPLDTLNLSVAEGTRVKWVLKCNPAIGALDVVRRQVDTITGIAGAAGDDDTFTMTLKTLNDKDEKGRVTEPIKMGEDTSTTAAAIRKAINTDFDGIVTATLVDENVTVTADIAGAAFTLSVAATDGPPAAETTAAVSSLTIVPAKLPAIISEDGLTATFEMSADKTFKYSFHWTERKHSFKYDDIQHLVRVVPDRIPTVNLKDPKADGVATENKDLAINAEASDDHQLGSAQLMYAINDSEEKSIELKPLSIIRHKWTFSEDLPDLKPGDRLAFYLKVSDNLPPKGNHFNISATRKLVIKTQEEYLNWFKDELDAQREIIGKARDLEKKATTEVSKLKNEETKEEPKEDKEEKEEPKQ